MDFHDFISYGVKNIMENDFQSQKHYIGVICSEVRGIEARAVFSMDGFFIPNEDYLKVFFPACVTDLEYGMYNSFGQCLWQNELVFPVYNINDRISGLVGYNPFNQILANETGNYLLNHYNYSLKRIFKKGDYLFAKKGTYLKALDAGYLIVVDGVFDAISLADAGYLAAALLGSTITPVMAAQLRFIPRIIVAADNDAAGLALYGKIKDVHNGAVMLKQGKAKDADDILKSKFRDRYLKALNDCIKSKIPLTYTMDEGHLLSFSPMKSE